MAENKAVLILMLFIDEPRAGGGIAKYESDLYQSPQNLGCDCVIFSQDWATFVSLHYEKGLGLA